LNVPRGLLTHNFRRRLHSVYLASTFAFSEAGLSDPPDMVCALPADDVLTPALKQGSIHP